MTSKPDEIRIKDWKHFSLVCNQLEGYGQDTSDVAIFRGQRELFRTQKGNKEELRPSLTREILKNKKIYPVHRINEIEKDIKQEFINKWFFNEMRPYLEHCALHRILFIMQHYGIKTRFLDWTLSWKVAAYFATTKKDKNNNKDGVVWYINKTQVEKQFQDICKQYKKRSQFKGSFLKHDLCWDLTDESDCPVRHENIQIQCNAVFFKDALSTSTDVRMIIQASIFSYNPNPIADHLECITKVLSKDTKKYCKKIIIPQKLIPEFRSHLEQSQYTNENLFPIINEDINKKIAKGIMKKYSKKYKKQTL